MDRLKALAAASKHVGEVLAERNSRGYPAYQVNARERIELELRIAAFLCEEGED